MTIWSFVPYWCMIFTWRCVFCNVYFRSTLFLYYVSWRCVFCVFTESEQGPHEKRLLNKLLNDYNILERPVANESEPLLLSFGLTLQQIIDVVSWHTPNYIDQSLDTIQMQLWFTQLLIISTDNKENVLRVS